jgi:hypothetical protein
MRLSEWRAHAPMKDSVSPKVVDVVQAAIVTLGAEADPDCWIVWGDDPSVRYVIFVPIAAGLIQLNVRVMVPGEGPRAAGKVIRWNRAQLGELAVEIHGGHRLVTFQVEGQVLSGADAIGDAVSGFAGALFAAMDGRSAPVAVPMRRGSATSPPRKPGASPARAAARAPVSKGS